ncbi:MAG: type III-A CRISPR-associated RAMP protein Csm3 [Alistipes sp.]|nr:type III-A CRISPR-associated RAMP protein Csm3 [Alistipes sp.]
MTQLKKKIRYTAKIRLLSGMHIGGTNIAMSIGGPDRFVVRNPIDQHPYIPGSSLKGKMRSLLELSKGEYVTYDRGLIRHNVSTDPVNTISGHLFGTAAGNANTQPSRVIIRDAMMSEGQEERLKHTDLYLTESKTEVTIDRITAHANPRTNERVPMGVTFDFEAILNIFEGDNEQRLISAFEEAKNLLELDYIGGHGSRGYGNVEFVDWTSEVVWEA